LQIATEHFYDAHSDFPSGNQKMHSIFCGRHTGRPYDINDGYAPNAFPSGESGQAKLGRMRSNSFRIFVSIAFGDTPSI
jgi:hypothetical protein